MSAQELFDVWAPDGVLWSQWVKPVLFATQDACTVDPLPPPGGAVNRLPAADGTTALILELPSDAAIRWACAAAARGYRPVLLHNVTDPSGRSSDRIATLWRAICAATPAIADANLPPFAPPAFVLDSSRLMGMTEPGMSDLRWMVFPQDFPSGGFLRERGLRSVILLQAAHEPAASDLAHILREWSGAGVLVNSFRVGDGDLAPLEIPRPRSFGMAWHRAMATLGLSRNSAAGFGAVIPIPGSGG